MKGDRAKKFDFRPERPGYRTPASYRYRKSVKITKDKKWQSK